MEITKGLSAQFPCIKQKTQPWLELRLDCDVTASEVGAACSLHPHQSRAALLRQKRNKNGTPSNWFMEQGDKWEDPIADGLSQELKAELRTFGFASQEYYCSNGLRLKVGASPDRVMDTDQGIVLVEIKWAKKDRTEIPVYHLTQMLCQCAMMNTDTSFYACYSHDTKIARYWRVKFDMTLWDEHFVPVLFEFKQSMERGIFNSLESWKVKNLMREIAVRTEIYPDTNK